MERLPVLVKSVLSAPEPEYTLLTASALSAQTIISQPFEAEITVSEHPFKIREHVYAVGLFEDAAVDELSRKSMSRKLCLNNIGPIQTVHTIRPYNRCLLLDKIFSINFSISKSAKFPDSSYCCLLRSSLR